MRSPLLLILLPLSAACQPHPAPPPAGAASAPVPTCEWCGAAEAPAALSDTLRMPPTYGEPLVVTGTVTRGGRPAPGVLLYAYHTDASGRYTPSAHPSGNEARHGRLRGWLRTGQGGRYRIETVRPGPYPGRPDPQHLHLTVQPPGEAERWIDEVVFDDDPRLTPTLLARQEGRGGSGVTHPLRDKNGVWHAVRDIDLAR